MKINTYMFNTEVYAKILKIAKEIRNKILMQVEGSTCSGKTSFVLDVSTTLEKLGVDVIVIEEAAAKIFRESNLLEKLSAFPQNSKSWIKAKKELQNRVLFEQLESLEKFVYNDECRVALMDRGGASTAYHTIPLLTSTEKVFIERTCEEMAKLSEKILLLSPLGFIETISRYQTRYVEIESEDIGIKSYLEKWGIDYIEIPIHSRLVRQTIGVEYIINMIN